MLLGPLNMSLTRCREKKHVSPFCSFVQYPRSCAQQWDRPRRPGGGPASSLRPSLALPAEGTSRHPGPPRRDRGGPGCLLAQGRDASRPRSAWPPLRLAGSRLGGRRRLRGFFLLVEESGELGLLAGGQVTVDDAP